MEDNIKYQSLKAYKYNLKRDRSLLFILFYNFSICFFSKHTPKFMHKWRVYVFRIFGAKIGKDVKIAPSAKLLYPWNIEIGDYCWIGDNCNLYSVDKIKMGSNVALAHNVFLATAAHDIYSKAFETTCAGILIEDEVWISSNVFVMQGVKIGKGVVVGACSVVTQDLPEGYICLGSPAKPIKERVK